MRVLNNSTRTREHSRCHACNRAHNTARTQVNHVDQVWFVFRVNTGSSLPQSDEETDEGKAQCCLNKMTTNIKGGGGHSKILYQLLMIN